MAIHVYVGAYTRRAGEPRGNGDGISHYVLEKEGLVLRETVPCVNPSYLWASGDGHGLLAVQETADPAGAGGGLCSFALAEDGAVREQPLGQGWFTWGDHPCHVAVHPHGGLAAVANYSGGNFSLFRLGDNGVPLACLQTVNHQGHGTDLSRQERPHVHCMVFHPDGQRLYAVDLGLDRCVCYRQGADGTWTPSPAEDLVSSVPGAGFRHMVIHPGQHFAYVNGEMGNGVTCFRMGEEGAAPVPVGTWPALSPAERQCASYTAAMCLHPNGRFLYVSNRGADSIAVFRLHPEGAVAGWAGTFPAGGAWPRDMGLTPQGDRLVVAHQHSDTLAVFRLDQQTGMGTLEGITPSPTPVCLVVQER